MSIVDKLKGLLRGRETKVKSGIDKVSDTVEKRVGDKNAGKVENAAEKAKDAVEARQVTRLQPDCSRSS